jgi:hypothetical protein
MTRSPLTGPSPALDGSATIRRDRRHAGQQLLTGRAGRLRRTRRELTEDGLDPFVQRSVLIEDGGVGLGRTEVRWIESSEIAHEGESAGAYWFRDGKIITWQPFEPHAAALEETGLGE